MTPIPLPLLDGDTFICDNSTLELHQTCPRAAQYGIGHRRKGVGDRIALQFGGAAHKCLETRYLADLPMLEQTSDIQKLMVKVAEDKFNGRVDPNAPTKDSGEPTYLPGHEPIITPPDDYRNLDRMIDLIQKYGETYQYEPFELVRFPDGTPFVEKPFLFPLGEIPVNSLMWIQNVAQAPDGSIVKVGPVYQKHLTTLKVGWMGKIDLAYTHSSNLYIMDHKTSSLSTNMAEFEISNQFYGYVWAVERMLATQVSGFVINRIVCRKPTRTGIPFTFERKPIPVQRGLVTDWATETLYMVADFVEMSRRQMFPKHTVWCVGKFGTCQFHRVCQNDNLAQRDFLVLETGEFEDNVWSPLKED